MVYGKRTYTNRSYKKPYARKTVAKKTAFKKRYTRTATRKPRRGAKRTYNRKRGVSLINPDNKLVKLRFIEQNVTALTLTAAPLVQYSWALNGHSHQMLQTQQ